MGRRTWRRTFEELAAVDLARGDFEGDDMALKRERVSLLLASPTVRATKSRGSRGKKERRQTYLRLVQQLDWYSDCARHDVSR